MAAPLDPTAKVERALKRSVWIFVPLTVAGAIVGASQFLLEAQLRGATPPWVIPFIAVDIPASGGIIYWLLRRGTRNMVAFVRGLGSRVRDAGLRRGMGLLLVFDNGLLLQVANNVVRFGVFLAADASALGATTLGETLRWGRTFRGKQRGRVGHKQRDTLAGAELDQIRTNLGARWAWLILFERRGGVAPPQGEPLLEAVAMFYLSHWTEKADQVRSQVDGMAKFLQNSTTMTFPQRRAVPSRRGRP